MLSREVMGALALAILWVNTLLIAAAALKAAAGLARYGLATRTVAKARVVRGDGPSSALAALEIDQVGRLAVGERAPSIHFHDRSHVCHAYGGRVSLEDGVEVEVSAAEDVDVWVDGRSLVAAAACATEAIFDAAVADARKARGYSRVVNAPISIGRDIFLGLEREPEGACVTPKLVATFDPRAWIAKRVAFAYAFALADVALAAACTAACLTHPLFGPVSATGAAAGFVFFLLIQPVGVSVRNALRLPSRAARHDRWTRASVKVRPAPIPSDAAPNPTRTAT